MLKIGITGGIGAGKTVVSRIFQTLGTPVYNADNRAKWLQVHDEKLKQQIKTAFGEESYTSNGALNRSYLANKVFNNKEELQLLNGLVHPAVASDFDAWCDENSDKPYVLKEAALLFETGSYKQLDATIVVTAPKDIRKSRVLNRDKQRTEKEVEAIMEKQMSETERLALADYVIHNDGNTFLIHQVLELHKQLGI
jgi:dephospho-CoA kinase